MNATIIANANLAEKILTAVKKLNLSSTFDNASLLEKRDKVLGLFFQNYELEDNIGHLAVKEKNTGRIVRDRFYNALSLNQVIYKIAKELYPVLGSEDEVKSLPDEKELIRYMKSHGISKHSKLRQKLHDEWVLAHQDEKIRQSSEYWI